MGKKENGNMIIIFPAEEENSSLRVFAKLVRLLDNKRANRAQITDYIINSGIQCVSVDKYASNSDLVKEIENGNYIRRNEQEINDFLTDELNVILYFKAYEQMKNRNLFMEEVLFPFVLYREYGKSECILVILPDKNRRNIQIGKNEIQEISNPISRYMYYESLCRQRVWKMKSSTDVNGTGFEPVMSGANDYYDQCFIYTGERVNRLIRNFKGENNNIVNLMPLIKLNNRNYSILSQSMEESFGKVQTFEKDWYQYDLYSKIQEKFEEFGEMSDDVSKRSTARKYYVTDQELYEKRLMTAIIQSICMNSLRERDELPKEEDMRTVFRICGHMSLLAFLFFTSYCKEIGRNAWSSWEDGSVLRLINLTQDYADGILQIIENAKEYADVGYMNYHIIKIDDARRQELKENYKEYFSQNEDINFLLQIQIIDMGQADIVSTFVKNNSIQGGDGEGTDLCLKDFFEPLNQNCKNEFHAYYEDARNVAQHYGLRQFVSIVKSGKGYFEVSSTQKSEVESECRYSNYDSVRLKQSHIPGTEYKIFLPVQHGEKVEQKAVGFGAKLDYEDIAITDNWECKLIDSRHMLEENDYLRNISDNQQEKVKKVELLTKYLLEQGKGRKRKILCIDVKSFQQMWQIEILTKALLLYIVDSKKIQRIGLYNSTRSFMINFTRYLCNFYNNIAGIVALKQIGETQIYVCKDDYSVDLGFKGDSLTDAFMVCDYLARTRGVFNDCLDLIQSMAQVDVKGRKRNQKVRFAPFDLLIDLENCCLFEKRVKNDLQKDIQEASFGCCLHNSHMKVGSKMHITDNFYDATLLFASGYYTSRFAYILSKKIAQTCSNEKEKLTLVGYENFSELLLTETRRLLIEIHKRKDVDYLIFEQGVQNGFKFAERDKGKYADRKFVVIVPVNCTLTTHSKIEMEIKNAISQNAVILMNLTVIIIRSSKENDKKELIGEGTKDIEGTSSKTEEMWKEKEWAETDDTLGEIEKKYWKTVDTKKRVIRTTITNPEEVYYNVLLSSKWENPLVCRACFPPAAHPEREKPMLTMSYTSVIPMVLIGLNKKFASEKEKNGKVYEKILELNKYAGNISMLKDCMIYGHVKNGSNHFEYYFETELLMKQICEETANNSFSKWIEKLKNVIENYKKITQEEQKCKEYIYDILVAPMNRTNATFVEYVNMHAFESVPIIVYIDANREFRDNIRTKYSNLTALYHNLTLSNKKAVINFHYVDDCIISGTTFYRTKSLLQSLFPVEAFLKDSNVYVDIFQSVILLLNRCSNFTKLNYARVGHFFSYIDVHISSMRTHHDKACVLCENESHYRLLRDCSSTNEMAEEWNRKLTKNEAYSIETSRKIYVEGTMAQRLRNRHYRRLYCANGLSDELDRLGDEKNNTEKVKTKILEIINRELTDSEKEADLKKNLEWIISYFKVAARPFIVFRKSVLEAIFAILIETLEDWGKENEGSTDIISWTISKSIHIARYGNCETEFLKCLESLYRSIISLLSSLGSKYLIRKDSYQKLISNDPILAMDHVGEWQETNIPFELFYAANIKRMITLNKDETIGLWFENLLVNGCESVQDGQGEKDANFIKEYGIGSEFGRRLFLENTYIIFQTVWLIYEKCHGKFDENNIEKAMNNFDTAYYYENYRNLVTYGSDPDMKRSELFDETKQMVLLFAHLKENDENERNVVEYYEALAEKMQYVSGAKGVAIYGCSHFESNNDVYIIVDNPEEESRVDYEDAVASMNEYRSSETKDKLKRNIMICKEENYVAIKIDSNSEWRKYRMRRKNNNSDNIYCFFKYDNMCRMDDYEILRRIRNILVFRHTMLERFRHDFHNNAYKVFMEQKHRNKLIASNKAVSHTSSETLNYVTQEMASMETNDKNTYAAYALQLAADSLVSRLYVKMIQEDDPRETVISTSFEITDQMLDILKNLRAYSDNDSIADKTYTSLHLVNHVKEPISWEVTKGKDHYRILFLVAILYNALQHGLADEDSRKITVEIFREQSEGMQYLCFKNTTRYNTENDFKSGTEQGITIKALDYYFRQYLGRQIKRNTIRDGKRVVYTIKLPIYEEGDQ